jgi:SAM-dependent methyltransferase
MEYDYASLSGFLPVSAGRILDIGCGLAAIDVYLYRHYRNGPPPELFLLDRTELTGMPRYGLKTNGEFYNSLAVARRVLSRNGIPKDQVKIFAATADYSLPDCEFDLVVSLASWGFHYPVETYLDSVWRRLRPGGRIVIDVRTDSGGEKTLAKYFSRLQVLARPLEGKAIRFGAEKDGMISRP